MADTHYTESGSDYDFDSMVYEEADGTLYDVTEITYEAPDGTIYNVWADEVPIDVFDRSSLGYHIGDTGQSSLPQISSSTSGYDNDNAVWLPSDNPNEITNLSPNNTGYDSSKQDVTLENYFRPGDIAEIYFQPTHWGVPEQFRFSFFADGYYPSNHIRLRFTDDYWRIEQGSSLYGGTGSAESFDGFAGDNWHRVVIDASSFPYIEAHLWDAGTGNFISTISGEDSNPDTDEPGHQMWWNDDTEMYVSDYRKIDSDDFTAGSDL